MARLGGIYGLDRIMIDSARDHPTIAEVLAAYVREHAHIDQHAQPSRYEQTESLSMPPASIVTDVQVAMTVLARRPSGRKERGSLDLQKCWLVRARLSKANPQQRVALWRKSAPG